MIRSLRRTHRATFILLTVIVPATLWLAIKERPSFPTVPPILHQDVEGVWSSTVEIDKPNKIKVQLIIAEHGPYLNMRMVGPIKHREIMAYWTPDETSGQEEWMARAHLIGANDGSGRIHSKPIAANAGGTLHLYDLARTEHVGALNLVNISNEGRHEP